jgi:hypothetical protein
VTIVSAHGADRHAGTVGPLLRECHQLLAAVAGHDLDLIGLQQRPIGDRRPRPARWGHAISQRADVASAQHADDIDAQRTQRGHRGHVIGVGDREPGEVVDHHHVGAQPLQAGDVDADVRTG